MHVGRSGEYAMRTVLELAVGGPGTVEALAARHGMPGAYLQRLVLKLRAAGVVDCRRGPGGGLALARPADDITLLSVLQAVEGSVRLLDLEWLQVFPRNIRSRLEGLEHAWTVELGRLTLADIAGALPQDSTSHAAPRTTPLPPSRLIELLGRQVATTLHADHCAFYFGDTESGFLTIPVRAEPEGPPLGAGSRDRGTEDWIPLTPVGIVLAAARTNCPVLVSDVRSDARSSREMAERFGVRSASAVPVEAGDEGWGVLIVGKQQPHVWQPEEVNAEVELADVIRLAIIGHHHLQAGTPGLARA